MRVPNFSSCPILSALLLCVSFAHAAEPQFAWQRDYARVTETGDIEWTPEPFQYTAGESVRYVDYENGSDAADGASPDRPWKHHPWDARATGSAAAATVVDTSVFKGGVTYRGQLTVREKGRA
ncbi:MAG: hypothetical protein ACOY3P_02495, partial [Planctomycetota bacterium]